MRIFPCGVFALSALMQSCAIDTPLYNSEAGTICWSAFDLDKSSYSFFSFTGALNGTALSESAGVTSSVPLNAPATRQIIVNANKFSLTINLAASSYGTKTVATGNPEVWLSAVTCSEYLVCSTERYLAGYYNSTLRGAGTVSLTRPSVGATQIVLDATLPDENTSLSQSLQFQNVTFAEVCY